MPSEQAMESAVAESRATMTDKPLDGLKQRALYVGIGADGRRTSSPTEITEDDFARALKSAQDVSAILDLMAFYSGEGRVLDKTR
jgi:hypothetical protein